MPFTPSHAVVALAFVRTPLVPAAIAVGAMTPDLPLFVRGMFPSYAHTHDFTWLPLTVIVALALLLVWWCLLRPVSSELAPRWLAERLPGEWDEPAGAALRAAFGVGEPGAAGSRGQRAGSAMTTSAMLLLSLALGAATHIVWDLFTHEGRAGTEMLPILNEQWGPAAGYELQGYKWLQHGSSAVGLALLVLCAVVWLRGRARITPSTPTLPRWVRVSWWLSLPLLLVAAWVWGLWIFGPLTTEWTVAHLAYRVLPPAAAGFGFVTLALSLGVQALHARRRSAVRQAQRA
ncbi:MAG: DUF4184 family protein [Microbacteriaceae bacterium]|nr:DUF4184 family protein [Microbacteriaceae bacterium]HQC93228.1 DUF4184 family protein [Microbacteriaceae bacterium]